MLEFDSPNAQTLDRFHFEYEEPNQVWIFVEREQARDLWIQKFEIWFSHCLVETLFTYSLFLGQLRDVEEVVTELLMCCVQNQLQSQDIANVEGNRRMLYETSSYRPSPGLTYPPPSPPSNGGKPP